MVIKVLLPGHAKTDAITLRDAKARVDDDGMLVVTREKDDTVELGRFEQYQAYWVE